MKVKYRMLLIVSLYVMTTACDQTKKNDQESLTKPESNEAVEQQGNKVKLDNGKPWQANQETTEGIRNMIELMESFTDHDNPDSYEKLADDLNSDFNTILKKCTMKGEAHDQLHNYQVPMKEMFQKLSSGNLNECRTAFDDLKKHLMLYKDYFE